jgi:YVTN family beta-propeller protein
VRRAFGLILAAAVSALTPCAAAAQTAYVANSGSGTVSVLDPATARALAPPIAVGSEPTELAVSPDASRLYVTNAGSDTVSVIDTATNSAVARIPVGSEPTGIAVSPDGARAYLTNSGDDTVSAIDTATNTVVGPPIAVGDRPEGIALLVARPQALVAQRGGNLALLDLGSGAVIATLPDALGPSRVALTPDGTRAFATNAASNSVTIFSLITGTALGVPILIGANPSGVALASNGFAYAASASENTVSALDAATHARLGPPISGFSGPWGLAASADGTTVLVANSTAASVSVLDTGAAAVIAQAPVGASPRGIAISPDQPPRASFVATRAKKEGQHLSFEASASADPDGEIASYAWDFGDGESELTAGPLAEHRYARPGTYRATLTLADRAGCSTAFLFTGQSATCNGSPLAAASRALTATDTTPPVLRLSGARRQALGPAVFLLARCPRESCSLRLKATLSTVAHPPKRRPLRARFALAPKRVRIPAGGRAAIRLALGAKARRAARRALALGGTAQVRVRVAATDAAANKSVGKRAIALLG